MLQSDYAAGDSWVDLQNPEGHFCQSLASGFAESCSGKFWDAAGANTVDTTGWKTHVTANSGHLCLSLEADGRVTDISCTNKRTPICEVTCAAGSAEYTDLQAAYAINAVDTKEFVHLAPTTKFADAVCPTGTRLARVHDGDHFRRVKQYAVGTYIGR